MDSHTPPPSRSTFFLFCSLNYDFLCSMNFLHIHVFVYLHPHDALPNRKARAFLARASLFALQLGRCAILEPCQIPRSHTIIIPLLKVTFSDIFRKSNGRLHLLTGCSVFYRNDVRVQFSPSLHIECICQLISTASLHC